MAAPAAESTLHIGSGKPLRSYTKIARRMLEEQKHLRMTALGGAIPRLTDIVQILLRGSKLTEVTKINSGIEVFNGPRSAPRLSIDMKYSGKRYFLGVDVDSGPKVEELRGIWSKYDPVGNNKIERAKFNDLWKDFCECIITAYVKSGKIAEQGAAGARQQLQQLEAKHVAEKWGEKQKQTVEWNDFSSICFSVFDVVFPRENDATPTGDEEDDEDETTPAGDGKDGEQ
jgi:hypothetical protein